jgi:hypothetical protein
MRASSSQNRVEEKTRHILSEIFGSSPKTIGVRLWDGTAWPDERPHTAVLALKHPEALGWMFLPGTEVGLAEAYLHDDFDIEGDIEAAFELADFLLTRLGDWKKKLKIAGLWLRFRIGTVHRQSDVPQSGCYRKSVASGIHRGACAAR